MIEELSPGSAMEKAHAQQPESLIRLPDFMQRVVERWKANQAHARERKQAQTENEAAKERMSQLCSRLRSIVDTPEFRARERQYQNRYEDSSTYTGYSLTIPAAEHGYNYSIDIRRDGEGRANRVGVYTYADGDRTTGYDDGRWNISFHEEFRLSESKQPRRLEIWDAEVEGEFYLGRETTQVIERLRIDSQRTHLHLKGVDFGGHPSAHVWLQAWGEESDKEGQVRNLGPIGKIRNVHVLGIARALLVTKEHISDTSSLDFPITDDFEGEGFRLDFDRGSMDMAIKKVVADGKEMLHIAFSGIRQRLRGIGARGERLIEEEGREVKQFSIDTAMLNGNTVLEMLEKEVAHLEEAVATATQLPQLPS